MTRRHDLIPFRPALIADYLKGRTISSFNLLPGGRSNSNYKLKLSDGTCRVCRIFGSGTGEPERHITTVVHHLIPVPRLCYHTEDFAIYSFVSGEPLKNNNPEQLKAAARVLARLSTISFNKPGQILSNGQIKPWPFDGCRGFIALMLANPKVQKWLQPGDSERLFAIMKIQKHRLDTIDKDCVLVHGDLNPGNILLVDNQVTGILDWEFAHSGTPYADIGNLLRHTPSDYHKYIKIGLYDGGFDLPEDWKIRARLVDITSDLEFLTTQIDDCWKQKSVKRIKKSLTILESL